MAVKTLDTIGLVCPLPVLKAEKAMRSLPASHELVVRASDPMVAVDIPHMCRSRGYELVACEREADIYVFRIRHQPTADERKPASADVANRHEK